MFDILDLVKRRKKEVFSGYYYEYKTSAPVYFEYKNQNYPRSVFTEVINNLIVEGRNLVITTTWALKWKLNSKIVLQDGKTYTINEMSKRSPRLRENMELTVFPLPNVSCQMSRTVKNASMIHG